MINYFVWFFFQLPEMNLAAEEEEQESGTVWVAFFIQNIGIIVGFCIILVMSVYGGEIDFSWIFCTYLYQRKIKFEINGVSSSAKVAVCSKAVLNHGKENWLLFLLDRRNLRNKLLSRTYLLLISNSIICAPINVVWRPFSEWSSPWREKESANVASGEDSAREIFFDILHR